MIRWWQARRRARSEDGVLIVEAAIVAPLLAMLLFGIAEYSMAWRADNHTAKVLRNSIVEVARNPADRLTDYRVLDQVRQATGTGGLDSVTWVIVYKASATSSAPPTACVTAAGSLTSGSTGVSGVCNVYSSSFVLGATSSQFVAQDCSGEPDRWLCPVTRRTVFAAGERIGVAIRWRHRWVTKIVPGTGVDNTDYSVATLAPDPRPT